MTSEVAEEEQELAAKRLHSQTDQETTLAIYKRPHEANGDAAAAEEQEEEEEDEGDTPLDTLMVDFSVLRQAGQHIPEDLMRTQLGCNRLRVVQMVKSNDDRLCLYDAMNAGLSKELCTLLRRETQKITAVFADIMDLKITAMSADTVDRGWEALMLQLAGATVTSALACGFYFFDLEMVRPAVPISFVTLAIGGGYYRRTDYDRMLLTTRQTKSYMHCRVSKSDVHNMPLNDTSYLLISCRDVLRTKLFEQITSNIKQAHSVTTLVLPNSACNDSDEVSAFAANINMLTQALRRYSGTYDRLKTLVVFFDGGLAEAFLVGQILTRLQASEVRVIEIVDRVTYADSFVLKKREHHNYPMRERSSNGTTASDKRRKTKE